MAQHQTKASIPDTTPRVWVVVLASFWIVTTFLTVVPAAHSQTYQVLYNFTGGGDGAEPFAGLTMDASGNLYGTTYVGGYTGGACASNGGCGTVFKLTHRRSGWTFAPLYAFKGDEGVNYDPAFPDARVIFGPDGSLYGTSEAGGGGDCYYFHNGCGTVFRLSPPATVCKSVFCPWNDSVIYRAASDNGFEALGDVTFDAAGNLYSTVALGGTYNGGYAFELTPSHGGWTSQVIYAFNPSNGCNAPMAAMVFDAAGNLYGTANNGCGYGGVFQLVPSGSGWTENVLLELNGFGNGDGTQADLTPDGNGGFYGTATGLGPGGHGTVFQLAASNGSWTYVLVHAFSGGNDGAYPTAAVTRTVDASGTHLYGTTGNSGDLGIGDGAVYELTYSNGSWTETILHFFEGVDGKYPASTVLFDADGNMYGTTSQGGAYGYGVIWEITP